MGIASDPIAAPALPVKRRSDAVAEPIELNSLAGLPLDPNDDALEAQERENDVG